MERLSVFSKELELIKNATIKKFVTDSLEALPDYFFKVAASSTGKYHPAFALGEGGLVRHTKAAVTFAIELFRNNTVQNFTDDEKDIIVTALILHDGCKHGLNGSSFTVATHPKEVVGFLKENVPQCEYSEIIYSAIETHMGEWNTDFKSKKVILDKPKSKIQRFVHMCDYLASRKCIDMKFD